MKGGVERSFSARVSQRERSGETSRSFRVGADSSKGGKVFSGAETKMREVGTSAPKKIFRFSLQFTCRLV